MASLSGIFLSSPLQFFADVKEAQDKMKKMQETMNKKYNCDRSTTATRLEDLLQDTVVGVVAFTYLHIRSSCHPVLI